MSKQSEKKVSGFQFLYLIVGLIGFGVFLLITSGVFKFVPKVSSLVNNNASFDEVHAGTNLKDLSEIKELEDIVKNNPDDYNSLLSLAHKLNDSGFFKKAVINYEKYLKKYPKSTDVIVDYGVCYYGLGEYDKAISILKNALQIESKHQIAHFNLGIVNFAKHDLQSAKSWWEKTIEIAPHSEVGHKAKELLNTQLRSK